MEVLVATPAKRTPDLHSTVDGGGSTPREKSSSRTTLPQHDNSPAQRHRRSLRAVVDTQLAQKAVDVVLDRAFGNGQSSGDFFVAQAFDNQLENVEFAAAQVRIRQALGQAR